MKIAGQPHKTLEFDNATSTLNIIDQTLLPFQVKWHPVKHLNDACEAISVMRVRGAPAIGAVAAYGMVLAAKQNSDWQFLQQAAEALKATRPTAVNLAWAVDRMLLVLQDVDTAGRFVVARQEAASICDEDIAACSAIGDYGCELIEQVAQKKTNQTINILTHCNAGWLATVDWGTALAPIYKAQAKGIDIHVWVDETRPRKQGALLTAFELKEQGVPCTLICDNSGGHLMQQGQVDLCIVGSDRTTANGDVCNKIGTYLKALAAKDNNVPFYVALPTSTIDWQLSDGFDIPIEERSQQEVLEIVGLNRSKEICSVQIAPDGVSAANPAFDITPAHLVSALITEKGVFQPTLQSLAILNKC